MVLRKILGSEMTLPTKGLLQIPTVSKILPLAKLVLCMDVE